MRPSIVLSTTFVGESLSEKSAQVGQLLREESANLSPDLRTQRNHSEEFSRHTMEPSWNNPERAQAPEMIRNWPIRIFFMG